MLCQILKITLMNRLQKATLISGNCGIFLSAIAAIFDFNELGYFALFLGRLASSFYIITLDKFRIEYLAPLAISSINAVFHLEQLLFAEATVSSIVYQLNAFHTFNKINAKNSIRQQ